MNRVYRVLATDSDQTRIMRGLAKPAQINYSQLATQHFYQKELQRGTIIGTRVADQNDPAASAILADGWNQVLEHDQIPFISYPYEWPFSMLKDAALLQLRLVEVSLENGWTLKDATPYNIQWRGAQPTFIDVVSFEPWQAGEPWVGYRQFCSMFLFPLMLRAHLGIDHLPLLRSYLDGIPPSRR